MLKKKLDSVWSHQGGATAPEFPFMVAPEGLKKVSKLNPVGLSPARYYVQFVLIFGLGAAALTYFL